MGEMLQRALKRSLSEKPRPPTIVIADWLKNLDAGQFTPFEAAMSLMNYLQDEGYYVMRPDATPPAECSEGGR